MFAEKGLWFLAGAIAEKLSEKFPSEPDTDVFAAELHHSVMDIRHRAVKALDSGAVEDARPLLYEYLSLVDADDDDRDTSLQERLDSHDRDIETALQQPESPDLSAELKLSLEGRAHDALEKGEIEKTTGILEGLALVDGSKAWQARERLGDVRLSQGDVPSARWHYEIALAQSPENTLLASKIEKIIKDRHNDEKIMEQTMNDPKTFGTQQPSEMASPEAMYASAQTRIEQEDYTAAVNVLENLLAKYPDYGLAHNDLGVLSFSRGDSEKSLFHYREAARIEPENTVFQKNLADFLYIVMGDVEPALKIYIDLLTKNPTDKETLLALGQICADQEKFDDAEVFYRRIQEIDPLNDDAQKGIAVLKERSAVAGPPPSGAPVQPSSPTGTYIEADSDHGMPSSVINAEISIQNRKRLIQIPEQQLSEANRIFDENAYAVLDRRRSNDSYTVFDVGAGVGLYALSVLNHRPDSQIFCFETADRSRSLLEINVGDMPGIVVCKFGLCNGGTEASLAPHAQNMGAKSACCSGSCHNGGGDLLLEDAGEQFDALGLTHLDVLKIETRGNEIDILESMGARLDSVDYILAAYHSEKDRRAIDALLIRFHLFGAANTTLGGGMVKYVHPALI